MTRHHDFFKSAIFIGTFIMPPSVGLADDDRWRRGRREIQQDCRELGKAKKSWNETATS